MTSESILYVVKSGCMWLKVVLCGINVFKSGFMWLKVRKKWVKKGKVAKSVKKWLKVGNSGEKLRKVGKSG